MSRSYAKKKLRDASSILVVRSSFGRSVKVLRLLWPGLSACCPDGSGGNGPLVPPSARSRPCVDTSAAPGGSCGGAGWLVGSEPPRASSRLMPCALRRSALQPFLENHLSANRPYCPFMPMTSWATLLLLLVGACGRASVGASSAGEAVAGEGWSSSLGTTPALWVPSSSETSLSELAASGPLDPFLRASFACLMTPLASAWVDNGIKVTSVTT